MCDGVKCSALWSNVRLLEVFNRWKRIIEKRMGCKLSLLRKLWPFCPPNLTHHLQLQKSWSEIIDSLRFYFSQLLDVFAGNRLVFFRDFPSFRRKLRTFVKKSRLIIEKTSEEIKIPSDEKEIAREENKIAREGK